MPARNATLFGDGRQAFPSEELSKSGFDANDWRFARHVGTHNDPSGGSVRSAGWRFLSQLLNPPAGG